MVFAHRYLITLFASVIRAVLNFVISISIARYLMPEAYGEYQYILSILTAIFLFANLGTNKAYYTFISKKQQSINFHLFYFLWQFILLFLILFIINFLNAEIYQFLFKDTNSVLVFVAIVGVFFANNVQNIVNQLFDCVRKTQFSQVLSIVVALIHFSIIAAGIYFNWLTIKLLFVIMTAEYLFYAIVSAFLIKYYKIELFSNDEGNFDFRSTIKSFYIYSKPLFIFSVVSFVYTFLDRWLIQTYIGSDGQAFFSISMQFSTLTILITSSVLRVFWKEISYSLEHGDTEQTKKYFITVSDCMFIFTTVVSSTLFFFSDSILYFFYSNEYSQASLVFKWMMLYPIVQSMGQLYSTYLLASEQTNLYKNVSLSLLILGIALSILLFTDFGFNMGVEGMAAKLLFVDTISILLLEFYILKSLKLDDFVFRVLNRVKYILIIFIMSYLMFRLQQIFELHFLIQMSVVGFIYILPISAYMFKKLQEELH